MTIPELKVQFSENKPLLNILLSSGDPFIAEITCRLGFPSVMVDMQHGLQHTDKLFPLLQALPDETIALVRIPWNDPAAAMKALDAGADGVICPMVNNATEVHSFVEACQYPPNGVRSFGPIRRQFLNKRGDYFAQARENLLTAVMIETSQALEDIDAIAATEGLDLLFVGPFDLSVSLQRPERANFKDPVLLDALQKVLEAAKKHGKYTAIFTVQEADAKFAAELGFNMVSFSSDIGLYAQTIKSVVHQLQDIISAK